MTQEPLFELTDLALEQPPLIEVNEKAVQVASVQAEITRLERKLMRLKNCAPGAYMGPSGDYKLRMIRWTENKLKKLNKQKEEILNGDF